jgi:DNA-binding transcriptional LysR family regulator
MLHDVARGPLPSTTALPNLTTQQLEYLDRAAAAPTWASAAESLGVSPSALSQGLAELERRLGVTLFEPEGRRRVPTDAARPVIDHARRVLAQTRDLADQLAAARAGRTGRLRVGMIDAAAVVHHAAALRGLRRDHPEVDLHLAVAPSGELLAQLRAGLLDLVVCVAPSPGPAGGGSLSVTPLLDEPLLVYAPAGATPGAGDAGAPAGWGPWVTFPEGSHTRALIERALVAAGATVDVVAESHQPDVLGEMVRLGLGWSVLPASQAPPRLRPARPEPLLTRSIVAARRADALPHPAADLLLARLSGRRPS